MRSAVIAAIVLSLAAAVCPAGENYAFLVAVAEYDRTELNPLKFTRSDIFEFRKSLIDAGFKAPNIVLMHDDPEQLKNTRFLALAANIREELSLLLGGLSKDDSLIVAFTGHGIQFEKEKDSYFCPRDARLTKRDSLVSFAEVFKQMEGCPAGRKLLLVDACRNAPQSDLSKARSEVNLESVTRPQDQDVPEGMVALFSCRAGQKSFEDPDVKHGIFFHHVLKGWSGEADSDRDRKLTFRELESYVSSETTKYARLNLRTLQTPQLKGDLSGDWTLRTYDAAVLKTITSATTGMKLVLIPAGGYLRGSLNSDKDANDNEKPQHRVKIMEHFYLGMHEVTQGEWKAVLATEPWKGKTYVEDGRNYPATFISWDDAQEFVKQLSQKDGRTYRLPTEAEWEYAARGGTTTRYSFGDGASNLSEYAWWGGFFGTGNTMTEEYAHPVGLKKGNPFGLFDIHGNVWEWCSDWYDTKEYAKHAGNVVTNPQGPSGPASLRVYRGGSWYDDSAYCRSAIRDGSTPRNRSCNVGFRVAAVPSAKDR